jgi:hypothetical protein
MVLFARLTVEIRELFAVGDLNYDWVGGKKREEKRFCLHNGKVQRIVKKKFRSKLIFLHQRR